MAIASFYSGAKVCHIEADENKWSPFPEATIRSCMCSLCAKKTQKLICLKENEDSVQTGNTVIDALFH